MRNRFREWLRRYLPAEILSLAATSAAAWLTYQLGADGIRTALAATWSGNVAYFGYILAMDIQQTRQKLRARQQLYRWPVLLQNFRALAVEFGLAEVADSFFIRPMLMYYLPLWVGNLSAGILLAKLAADVTFYIPAIISYELSKKQFRKFQ